MTEERCVRRVIYVGNINDGVMHAAEVSGSIKACALLSALFRYHIGQIINTDEENKQYTETLNKLWDEEAAKMRIDVELYTLEHKEEE